MSLDQPPGRQPDYPVAPQFPARWSPRSFTDRALSEAEVMTLLEAARWAPSASTTSPGALSGRGAGRRPLRPCTAA